MLCGRAPTSGAGSSSRTWNALPVVSTLLPTHHRTTKALARVAYGAMTRSRAGRQRASPRRCRKLNQELLRQFCVSARQRNAVRSPSPTIWFVSGQTAATFGGGDVVTTYRITLRDRATQAVVGYYNGSWTTDRCRAVTLRKREAAEAHAALMRDRTPRNAELIQVEESAAAD